MEERRDRKGLFQLLKKTSTSTDHDSSNLSSPASNQSSRSVITNKIFNQRQIERKEHRDKLLNRVRTTSALSAANSRTTTPSHQTTRPPIANKSQYSAVSKSRPVSKPPVSSRPPSAIESAKGSNDSLSTTYTIDQAQNVRSQTVSSLNRKKLLEEWRKKKIEEEEKLKAKKPAFKAGIAESSKITPKPNSTLPTSSSFNFSLSIPGSSLMKQTAASFSKKTIQHPAKASKPPIRSQSVRNTITKETPKTTVYIPKPKQTPVVPPKPMLRKHTAPEKKLTKQVDLTKEIDIITNKLNSSVSLQQERKTLGIRIEITNIENDNHNESKVDNVGLNETRLETVQPNDTSSPIKLPQFTQEYFGKIEPEKRDVKYYKDLVGFNTSELNKLSEKWISLCSSGHVPEDIQGDIRSACGLAKLLIDERFAQFSDLIHQCEESKSEVGLIVKCTDLQGFWDMVDVQVQDVTKKFELLEKIKNNNYVKTDDMIEIHPVVATSSNKVFKPNKNYLRKKDQKNEEEFKLDKPEKKAEPKFNKLAEFKAKMKAMAKIKTDDFEIQIAETKPLTPKIHTPVIKDTQESAKGKRRSVRKSVVINDVPIEKKYNLRSRPSDLIKFDSPCAPIKALENLSEESSILSNASNLQSPVALPKKSKKKSIYPVIDEDEVDKENEDFFTLDDCPQLTWRSRPSIYPTSCQTPGRLSTTPRQSINPRESVSAVASSPLLKLALISSQSKRLSVNSLNRIFDKLE